MIVRKSLNELSQLFQNLVQMKSLLSLEDYFKFEHSQDLKNLESKIVSWVNEQLQKKPTLSQKPFLEEKDEHTENVISSKKPGSGLFQKELAEDVKEDLTRRLQTFKSYKKKEEDKSELGSYKNGTNKLFVTPKTNLGNQKQMIQKWKNKLFKNVTNFLGKLNSPYQFVNTILKNRLNFRSFQYSMNEYLDSDGQYVWTVSIYYPEGWAQKRNLFAKGQSINEKTALNLACMLLVKKIFLGSPQTWILFQNLEKKQILTAKTRTIEQQMKMEELIKSRSNFEFDDEKIFSLILKQTPSELMQDVCAKQQLQYILSYFPNEVSSPKKPSKPIIDQKGNKLWQVSTSIHYRNQKPFTIEKITNNRVLGEQKSCLEAISKLYHQVPYFFKRVQLTKAAYQIAFGPSYSINQVAKQQHLYFQ